MHRQSWSARRVFLRKTGWNTGAGGSAADAAAILGISPFATARDLFYDKLKIVPFDDSESNWVAKKMGHLLEDLVAEIFHVKTGYRIYQIKKMFYHPVYTFMLADIDYFVELPGGRTAILEKKPPTIMQRITGGPRMGRRSFPSTMRLRGGTIWL